jgi:hypothetical protein
MTKTKAELFNEGLVEGESYSPEDIMEFLGMADDEAEEVELSEGTTLIVSKPKE